MFTLSYEFKNNIPLFRCDLCGNCSHVLEAKSLLNINRGCCWYFPKYNLFDIKNIINNGKMDFIYEILNKSNAYISQYYIELKGLFYKDKYEEYISTNEPDKDFDSKLFFRFCPFLGKNGCTIDFSLRPHPCNLYLCRKVIESCNNYYKAYSRERKDYYSYCNYFHESLKYELEIYKADLLTKPVEALKILEQYDMPEFDPQRLEKIRFSDLSCEKTDNSLVNLKKVSQ